MSDSLLDPREFPFTEDELYRALCLLQHGDDAREETRIIAEYVRGEHEGGWSLSDEVFAALALLSPELHARIDAYMRARFEDWRSALVNSAVRGEGLPHGSDPTPSAIRAGDEAIAAPVADWQRGCASLAEWVRRRQAGEPVGDEPPPWPGQDEG